jgi:LPXTG-motif cell wall-anchored protein
MKKLLLFGILSLFILSSIVLAGPTDAPHQFYGTVTVNGEEAPSGILVVARINGVDVASTTTTSEGYGYAPNIFYIVDDASDRKGDQITFYVKDNQNNFQEAGSFIYQNGYSTELNLVASGVFTNSNSGSNGGSSGGGGGGSSGGSSGGASSSSSSTDDDSDDNTLENDGGTIVIEPSATSANTACTPDWFCSGWETCVAGTQRRTCVDNNACGVETDRPVQRQSCETVDTLEETAPQNPNFFQRMYQAITGAVVGAPDGEANNTVWWLVAGLVAIAGLGLFFVFGRKKKQA